MTAMSALDSPVMRVEGLSVSFGALHALSDVSWACGRGEILGLIGPNGAGKSTCFEASTHLVPRRGRVYLDEEDISSLPPGKLFFRGVRRAFQQNAFYGGMTVRENMAAVIQHEFGTPLSTAVFLPWVEARRRRRAHARAEELLESFGVAAEFHSCLPADIPYGVQRMLSVAMAYAGGAKVLLLDEPAAGLGGADMARLTSLLLRLKNEGVALVVIEHHMDLIMSVADRIVVLDQGRVLATGTPAEVREDPRVLDAYLGGVH